MTCNNANRQWQSVWLGACVAGWAALGLGAAADLKIEPVADPPVVDGVLDDACWKTAAAVNTLYLHASDTPARDTTVLLARDNQWLYLGFACSNATMARVAQRAFKHDGAVHEDDSVEVFIRPEPAKKRYYQFKLNFANVTAEQRTSDAGSRDDGWNPPLRFMTRRLPNGWTAELAIPLFVFECDDLGGLQLNLCRNEVKIELDLYGAVNNEKTLYAMLRPGNKGSAHNFGNFMAVAGMGGFKPGIPFAPRIAAAEVTGYRLDKGSNSYGVAVTLDTASPAAGSVLLAVVETVGGKDAECYADRIELDGGRKLELSIPTAGFQDRQVRVVLADPGNRANVLASMAVEDTSALSVIRKAFVGRSYYTCETSAAVRLEFGLSAELLKKVTLAVEVNGKKVLEAGGLQPVMTADIPLAALALGSNAVTVRILAEGKELTSAALGVRRLTPRPGYETKVDFIKGVLLKDQQPIFPVAMMGHSLQSRFGVGGCADDDEAMFRYLANEIGFNAVVRSTGTNVPAFMRLAEKYGLNVITWSYSHGCQKLGFPMDMMTPPRSMDLPLPERLRIQRAIYDEGEPLMIAEARLLRDWKNFIGYYNFDEPNLINPDERIAIAEWYYRTVAPLDPYRPQFLLYSKGIPRGDNWTRWGEVLGYDVYPAPPYVPGDCYAEPGLSTAWYACDLRERCRHDNKAMFFVPLANMLDPGRTPIGLKKIHMLCQAYSAIIYGSRGLLYFALNNVIGEEAWDALKTINAQIRAMAPALLNGDIAQEIRYTPDNFKPAERKFPMVNAAVFQYPGGDYLLLAANFTGYAVESHFTVAGLKKAERLFERAKRVSVRGGAFADTIEPYGVRAYTLALDDSAGPVRVAVAMKAREDERAPGVDVAGIVRQVMMGKNHCPNPCFKRQTNKGIPDFCKPYFCLSTDPKAGQKGSDWFVDEAMPWNGSPSLRLFCRPLKEPGTETRGWFGAMYPPPADKPVRMTFSFYARGEKPGTSLWLRLDGAETKFMMTTEWARYHVAFDMPPGTGANMGVRELLMCSGGGAAVWINGLQMEEGGTPTEFRDDSDLVKKVAEDPGNLLRNGGAECASAAEFWDGLEVMRRGEPGVRRGAGRSGDYAFHWRGQSQSIRSDLVAVDPAKTYALKGFFKAAAPAAASAAKAGGSVLFGVLLADAEQREMRSWNVTSVKGTRTELASACKPGDTVLKLKDASAWKPDPGVVAAFGKEEGQLNFDVTPLGIAAVKPEGDHWRVVLGKPCGLAFPAGTPVVENHAGGNGIFFSGAVTNAWVELGGTIGPAQWWPGTKYVRVYIQPQSIGSAGTLLIDDVALKERTAAP